MSILNIVGQKFGRLTAISFMGMASNRISRWKFKCDCGTEVTLTSGNVKNGNTQSCGCWHKEVTTVHGHCTNAVKSKTYSSWEHMLQRCSNPKFKQYKDYGGRGIQVCERWLEFANFLEDMGERQEGKTLDRFPDNDGNYEPSNCRWATRKEQQANTRKSKNKLV